jgi:hypothetical protein
MRPPVSVSPRIQFGLRMVPFLRPMVTVEIFGSRMVPSLRPMVTVGTSVWRRILVDEISSPGLFDSIIGARE